MVFPIVSSSDRCQFDPEYLAPAIINGKNGIRCYSHISGVVMQLFGFAYEFKDNDNVVCYLNRDDLRIWLASYGYQETTYKQTKSAIKNIIRNARANHSIAKGDINRKKNGVKDSILNYTEALQYNPRNVHALIGRALCFRQQLEYTLAIADCNLALNLSPEYAYAWAIRGDSYRMLQDHEIAIRDLQHALKMDPSNDFPLASLAESYRCLGCLDEAFEFVNKALAINPKNGFALSSLSDTYLDKAEKFVMLQKYDEALECIQQAQTTDSKNFRIKKIHIETLRLSAAQKMHFKNYNAAISDLTKILKLVSLDEEALLLRATCYQHLDKVQLATENFETALSKYPTSLTVQTQFSKFCKSTGLNLAERGKNGQAKRFFNLYLKMNSKDIAACEEMGDSLSSMHNYTQALSFYSKAVELDPTNYKNYLSKGICAINAEMPEKALKTFKAAVKLSDNPVEAWKGRGECYRKLQNFSKAVISFKAAIELNPINPELYTLCAKAYYDAKNYHEALSYCDQALAIDPWFKQAAILRDNAFELSPLSSKILKKFETWLG